MVRVVDGVIRPGMRITFGSNDAVYPVDEVGYQRLGRFKVPELRPARSATCWRASSGWRHEGRRHHPRRDNRAPELLPGYREIKPMVFAACTRPRRTSTRSCATRSRS
jgi:GTP-binding protein LepA